jgi:curved DNA-binding protein CbpA
MEASRPIQDPMGQVLALASEEDPTQLRLSPAEGYLLSRIDGVTPWRLLREIGGIPPAEVDRCLTRWIEAGLLRTVGSDGAARSSSARRTPPERAEPTISKAAPPARPEIDDRLLDEALEIDLPLQRRILEFEASLARPYHELLGVERGIEPKAVKRAYFKLSKEFHPDRYFRREIGHYAQRLDRIFKKVLEAYEMLSDPDLCEVENQGAGAAVTTNPDSSASDETRAAAAVDTSVRPHRTSKLERLRQRMPFKIDHAGIEARRARALQIFKAAQASQEAGRLKEAESSLRIAISFDPGRAEFKEALGALRLQAAGARASKLLAASNDRMSETELREVLTLLEDVLLYRPHDPDLNDRAARICLKLGRLAPAREYAETCIARAPDVAAHHTLLGEIHREQGEIDAALHEFETALKYDAGEVAARRALASLRIRRRDAARGESS